VCRGLRGLVNDEGALPEMAASVAADLRQLGIHVQVEATPTVFDQLVDPTNSAELILAIAWQKDFGGAVSFIEQTLSQPGRGSANFPLVEQPPRSCGRGGTRSVLCRASTKRSGSATRDSGRQRFAAGPRLISC
jgi:hypothetical protein